LNERIEKAWLSEGRYRNTYQRLTFTENGLEIGNGTVVVKLARDEWDRPALVIDGEEERILALLSVAWEKPIPDWVIDHFRSAGRALSKGEITQAYIHIAYTGLQPLMPDPETLRLLFFAEGFLDAGISGNEIRKAWGLGKYNQNHYPSGSRQGGQFAPKDGGSSDNRQKPIPQGNIILASAQADDTNAKKERFVDAHLADAQRIADKLGVPVENILGLSALESGWGGENPGARFAIEANNFLSLHYPIAGASGYVLTTDGKVKVARFNSYADCLEAFANKYGNLARGVSDPAKFASILQNAGAYGINRDGTKVPSFVSDTASTIKGLRPVIARRSI